jgi:hypothetical protein
MHRFRLLGFYVAGIVGMVGLTIGGVSLRRTADDRGAREESEKTHHQSIGLRAAAQFKALDATLESIRPCDKGSDRVRSSLLGRRPSPRRDDGPFFCDRGTWSTRCRSLTIRLANLSG